MHMAVQSSERAAEGPESGRRGRATRVAVAGATGYTGQELLRLLSRHPGVTIAAAMSSGARPAAPGTSAAPRQLPALAHIFSGTITPLDREALARDADLVFLALPDKAAAELAPALVVAGVRVIDLSGAFRLRDRAMRARWYPETHELPEGLAYGLTELERPAVAAATLVANPGCYPTATLLPLAPLVASGVFGHRHAAEIEQGVGRTVNFVPHLMPLDRGILSTIYLRLEPGTTEDTVASVYEQLYGGQPFVRLTGSELPEIKHVA